MATVPVDLYRAAWLGHRWQRHGLAGTGGAGVLEDLLLLGVQGSRLGGAEQSLLQRTRRIGRTGIPAAIGHRRRPTGDPLELTPRPRGPRTGRCGAPGAALRLSPGSRGVGPTQRYA